VGSEGEGRHLVAARVDKPSKRNQSSALHHARPHRTNRRVTDDAHTCGPRRRTDPGRQCRPPLPSPPASSGFRSPPSFAEFLRAAAAAAAGNKTTAVEVPRCHSQA
jgi:hypothetical protein